MATGFAVIALLLNYMVMERSMRNAAADDAVANIANINSPFAAKMDLVVSSVARVLQIVDEIPVEQNPAGLASLRQAMATASKYSAVPISFGITDSTGRTIANSLTTDALSINVSDRDFFKFFARSDSDTLYIGQPISTRLPWGSSQRALPFSRALRDSTGRFQGIAVAVTPVDFLEDFFSAAAPDGRTVGIYRNEGELLVHMSSKAGVSGDEAAAIAKAVVAEQSSEGRSREVKVGDRTFFVAWLGVTGTDIGVFTALEERVAISAWHDALWQRAGIFAMMAFAMLAGGAAVDSGRSQRSQRETAATALSHAAFSAISDPLLLVDNDNRLLLVNEAARTHVPGISEGRTVNDVLPQLAELGYTGPSHGETKEKSVREIRLTNPDRWVLLSTFPVCGGYLLSLQDISELRQTENQLRQAQKMEAIGQLTGGVAHDFNNLLTVMIGNLDLICSELSETTPLGAAAGSAFKAAERAAELTSSLLAIGRRQPLSPSATDINKLMGELVPMITRVLPETIEVQTAACGELWAADVDRAQLETALLNLALNARDAMPQGGKLTIETSNETLDEHYASRHSEVTAGQFVLVAVSDTGTGIEPSIIERVFDPFFTTKDEGMGSGLGLSMVQGFIKQTGGHIKVYSEPGEGTTVKLYLPRAQNEIVIPSSSQVKGLRGGDETILLVEDDDLVRTHVASQINRLGYRLLVARNGADALSTLAENPVDLLLTDVMLPGGMNGRQLSDQARLRQPSLRTVYMSGYTRNAIVHHGRLDKDTDLLEKPFRIQDMAEIIRSVLDRDLES